MIENLEIRKEEAGYSVFEQAGSAAHAEQPLHRAAARGETEQWLLARGAAQADVTRALEEIESAGRVYVEIGDDYSESEGFPKKEGGNTHE